MPPPATPYEPPPIGRARRYPGASGPDAESLGFTVTPYDDSLMDAPRPRLARFDLIAAGLSVLAAALAILAPFLTVLQINTHFQDQDGSALANFAQGYRINGWGQLHVVSSAPVDGASSSSAGPKYGIIFCACAAIMLAGAVWQLRPQWRTRWLSPTALPLAGALLLGGAAAIVATEIWTDVAHSGDGGFNYHLGPAVFVVVIAAVIGLLPWLWQHIRAVRAIPVSPPDASPLPPPPQVEDSTGPVDLGTSAW